MSILSHILNRLAIKKSKIVFYSFTDSYADQPKYIAEEMLRRGMGCDFVWLTRRGGDTVPKGIRVVRSRWRMAYEMATAQVLISNTRMGKYFDKGYKKKKGQVYIQTWHGSFGIKKMEANISTLSGTYIRRARKDSRHIDYLLSNSRWLTEIYRACFFYAGPVVECGSPRNDLLFAPTEKAAEVRQRLGVPEGVRLVMYAPTFRRGEMRTYERMDYKRLTAALSARFGGEWRVMARVHPGFLGRLMHSEVVSSDVMDVSAYPDMAELLATADVLISDYSSCLYDYLLTGKPSFIYAPDIAEYEMDRGLYYPITETPAPLTLNNAELEARVREFDEEPYRKKIHDFLVEKGSVEDGHAAERAVKLLERILAK